MNHLFIIAHPDDELLGCCGTIVKLKERGDRVAVLTFSHLSPTREDDLIDKSLATHEALGVDRSLYLGYEMMRFATYDRYKMTKDIEEAIESERPDVVYIHDSNDIHNDHRTLSAISLEACKLPLRGSYDGTIKAIYSIEVPSSSDWGAGFLPNAYVEVSAEAIEMKARLLSVYEGVCRDVPHPRNIQSFISLARYRGGQCGCKYAEAYKKLFEVSK